MWVERSATENEKDLKKQALFEAGAFSLFVFALLALSVKIGFNKWKQIIDPIPWGEVPSRLPLILGASLVIFIGTYFVQKANNRRIRSRTFVCLDCGEECGKNSSPVCRCGSQCVDLNHAKWVYENGIDKRSS